MPAPLGITHGSRRLLRISFRIALHPYAVLAAALFIGLSAPHASATVAREVLCRDIGTGGELTIYAQQLLATGAVDVGWDPAMSGLCFGAGTQRSFGSVSDDAGGALIAWLEPNGLGSNVRMLRLNPTGAAATPWPVDGLLVCAAPGDQYAAQIARDGAGGAYVVWQDYRAGQGDIYAARIRGDASLAPGWPADGVALAASASEEASPQLVGDGQGGAYVSWQEYASGTSRVRITRLDANGSPVAGWPPQGLAVPGDAEQTQAQIESDGLGGVYVAWEHAASGAASGVRLLRFDADAQVHAGWPAAGVALSTDARDQRMPSLRRASEGSAYVAWRAGSGDGDVLLQRVTSNGGVASGWPAAGQPLCSAPGDQYAPVVAPDSVGGAFVAWEDYRDQGRADIYVQHLNASGVPSWDAQGVAACDDAGEQCAPSIALTAGGRVRLTWLDDRAPNRGDWLSGAMPMLQLLSVSAVSAGVKLTWSAPGQIESARLFRSSDQVTWRRVGAPVVGQDGRMSADDPTPPGEMRAWYRLTVVSGGREYTLPAVMVDLTSQLSLSLEGTHPNPTRGALHVAFTLPSASPATLELLDVAGRRVAMRVVGDRGPGRHFVELTEARGAPPGRYTLRLTQNGRSLNAPVTVLR